MLRDSSLTWVLVVFLLASVASASAWLRSCEMGNTLPEIPEDTEDTGA